MCVASGRQSVLLRVPRPLRGLLPDLRALWQAHWSAHALQPGNQRVQSLGLFGCVRFTNQQVATRCLCAGVGRTHGLPQPFHRHPVRRVLEAGYVQHQHLIGWRVPGRQRRKVAATGLVQRSAVVVGHHKWPIGCAHRGQQGLAKGAQAVIARRGVL